MRDKTGLPIHYDREVDHDLPLRLYGGWIPDVEHRALARAMTLSERGMVESRAAALELALLPFDERDQARLQSAVGAMFNGFRAMRQQGEDVSATVDITLGVLREFPAWAIERGCLKIARHEVGLDARWAPNDGQIADIVKEIIRPYRGALHSAEALLTAKIGREAERPPIRNEDRPTFEELQAKCAAAGIHIGDRKRQPPTEAETEAFLKKHGISREAWDAIPDINNG